MISESGLEKVRQASKGLPRNAGIILCTAMPKWLNHLPDEILQLAIEELQ